MSEGFMGRWSRRKQEMRVGKTAPEEAPVPVPALAPAPATAAASAPAASAPASGPEAEGEKPPAPPPLTLVDVQGLGVESDYRPFVAKEVAPEVRNAAFKRLFSDPHFNTMDGLDTYVDDYSKPVPLPDSVLRQMASASFLKLFDEVREPPPAEPPRTTEEEDVAQSQDSGEIPSPPVAEAQPASQESDDDHADLRLQPDDVTRGQGPRNGAG